MDTKQIQTNTFTDGLNTDLHPLTVPNTMLTDCINGTIITYNGNEYILQNDMGNYQLKKAQLPADYIPVGVKEYGNIIYIVSYNPLDKKCQVGSYPSPQTIFDNRLKSGNEPYKGIQINEFNDTWKWCDEDLSSISYNNGTTIIEKGNEDNTVFFTDYSSDQNLKVLFPGEGSDLKDTFLNPGDKYHLCLIEETSEDKSVTYAFQKIDFYTLTESKEVYKIDKDIEIHKSDFDHSLNDTNFKNVNWETPGWLGYKPSILNLDSFNIYVTDLDTPIFRDEESSNIQEQANLTKAPSVPPAEGSKSNFITFKLQGQITITPDFDWMTNYEKIRILVEYKRVKSEDSKKEDSKKEDSKDEWESLPTLIFSEKTDYGNKIAVLTYNSKSIEIDSQGCDSIVIRATPYILESDPFSEGTLDSKETSKGIIYDNFVIYQTINLKGIGNIKDVSCFDTYKYLVSDAGVTINFSILFLTKTSKDKIICTYQLKGIKDGFTGTEPLWIEDSRDERILQDCNLLGQNIVYIPLEYIWMSPSCFNKENIYIFSLKFYTQNEETLEKKEIYAADQLLITSEIMNDFYDSRDRFQDIYLNEWLPKVSKYQVAYYPSIKEYTHSIEHYTKTVGNNFESSYFIIDNLQQLFTRDTDKPFGYGNNLDTAIKNCKVEYDIPVNAYVGGINRIIDIQQFNLSIPLIQFKDYFREPTGLWADCGYNISVSARRSVKGLNTTGQSEWQDIKLVLVAPNKEDPDHPIPLDTTTIVDKNSEFSCQYDLIFANYTYYPFISSGRLSRRTGDRIYLCRNMPFLYGRQSGWGYEPKYLDKKISPLGMYLFQGRYPYSQWNIPYENLKDTGIGFGKKSTDNSRVAIYRTRDYVKTATFHTPDENRVLESLDKDNSQQAWSLDRFEAYVHRVLFDSISSVFIPVLFNVYDTGNRVGWKFPDNEYGHRDKNQGAGEGLGVLCKSGAKYTIAVIKFTSDRELRGKFTYTDESYQTYYLTNSHFNGSKNPWSYNDILAKYLLGIGLHLYYYTGLKSSTCYSIVNANQSSITNGWYDEYVKYTREDTLARVKYKNIELQNGYNIDNLSLENCTEKENVNLKLQNGKSVVFKTVVTKESTLKHDYYLNKYFYDTENYNWLDESEIIAYVSKVSDKVQETIFDINSAGSLNTRTVYNDYTKDPMLAHQLDQIAKLFVVSDFGSGSDYRVIYLKNLPEANIRGLYPNDQTTALIRSIDLSEYFNINKGNYTTILRDLSEVTPEWYEAYRKKVKDIGKKDVDYSLDEEEEEINNKNN